MIRLLLIDRHPKKMNSAFKTAKPILWTIAKQITKQHKTTTTSNRISKVSKMSRLYTQKQWNRLHCRAR